MIKYSVIVPVYNTHKELVNILAWFERVQAERAEYDIELVIVDDGSAQKLNKKFASNIQYYYKENGGVSSARNSGLKKAKGSFVLFLDSDDSYTDDIFTVLDNKLKLHKDSKIITFSFIKALNKKNKIIKNKPGLYAQSVFLKKYFTKEVKLHICGFAFSREFLLKENLLFDEKISHSEDILFVVETLFKTDNVLVIDSILFTYNCRENSAINSPFGHKALTHFAALDFISRNKNTDNAKYINFFLITCYINLLVFLIKNKTRDELTIDMFIKYKKILNERVYINLSRASVIVNLFRIIRFLDDKMYGYFLKKVALR
ncbi:glycosyltransferase family 2 protein [Endozoicomonas gorgoniicola]|uniref:Glycosyltransferase family 2 protein n=1 Tax=Endozoicomonas gorgoniicola TaxID=1234144 RepID=A0ABT3MPT1_9GAMM|nr:glycosyltransferase family 2 protein [Endozoicomonas gorgoniicola]MCW7551379.1 glycosyltransferase family 2 protein [Endozoicomonas gorgoniicola]